MIRSLAISSALLSTMIAPAVGQDIAAGETAFSRCAICHDVGEGAKNKIGPILNGLDGRKAGSVEGANYSTALKNSGITWNEQTFKDFIQNPAAKVPGTLMFMMISDPKEAGDVWAYIKQFGPDGPIVPSTKYSGMSAERR